MPPVYQPRTFSEYTAEALTGTLRQISRSFWGELPFTVRFGPLNPAEIRITFGAKSGIEITCAPNPPTAERRDFYTNRWMACWPLLAETRKRFPRLTGHCTLWADDLPFGPGLGFCGNSASTILIPDAIFLGAGGYTKIRSHCARRWQPWAQRRDVCFWRGSSSGSRHLLGVSHWRDIPRFKLCLAAKAAARPELLDFGISQVVQIDDPLEQDEIAQAGILKPEVPQEAFMQYKFGIDIDGNSCSWPGLFTKLLMGVTVLKVDSELGFRQWYYGQLVPWQNFVPVSRSLDHLEETIAYLLANQSEAAAIARRGRELANSLSWKKVLATGAARIAGAVQP